MNTDTSIQASFWMMVMLQTIGSVDMPGSGARKMPAPRSYMAIIIVWSVLQLGADAGYDRPASVFGWVVVLAGMVLGPFGTKVVNIFTSVANIYGNTGRPPGLRFGIGPGFGPGTPAQQEASK